MRAVTAFAAATLALFAPAAPAAGQERSPVVVDGAEDHLARAIQALLVPRSPPETLFQAERLSAEASERARLYLRSEGYYQAEVSPEPLDGPITARIVVRAGPLFTYAAPQFTFTDEAVATEAQAAVMAALESLRAGEPARAGDVLSAEAQALANLREAGFADAALAVRDVTVDHANQTMAVTFSGVAGPQVRLGGVLVASPDTLAPGTAERFAGWEDGAVYSPQALADLRRGVASSGAFTQVQTALAGTPNPDGSRDVVLTVEPAERRTIDLGVSWSSSEGAGAEAILTRRNVWRRAEALALDAAVAEQRQSLGVTASLPRLGPQGQTALLSASLSREDQGPYNRDALEAGVSFDARRIGAYRPSYGASIAAELYSKTPGVENAVVLAAFGEVRLDRTDFLLDARSGYDLRLRAEPSVSLGDASTGFVRMTGDARAFHTHGERTWLTLAARARAGWIEPVSGSNDDLPTDRLFYAGGGGSVRGYAFNTIFPEARQRAGLSPGGRGLLEVSAEARARMGETWGVVAFVDAGNAFDEVGDAGALRAGVGLGLRYDLGFAPLRLDIATPLDRRSTDDPVAVYFSIGQAF